MKIVRIQSSAQLKQAFSIREEVFLVEQKVSYEDEFDVYDQEARHFLVLKEEIPCGTARWRYTANGAKLERFAVLASFRRQGVASVLVQAVLEDIIEQSKGQDLLLYLHAQTDAVPLYEKFGFQISGDLFMECDIAHYPMAKTIVAQNP